MRPSRTDHLQSLWNQRPAQFGAATPEYRPFRGWYLVYDEPVSFGEDGTYLGYNWKEAEEMILWLCGKEVAA